MLQMSVDWKLLAQARASGLTDQELTRIEPIITAMKISLDQMAQQLPFEIEPAFALSEESLIGE